MQIDRRELDRLVRERRDANRRRNRDPASEAFAESLLGTLHRNGLLDDSEPRPPDDGDPRSEAQQFGDVLDQIRRQIKEN
ncbi:hypothetical protein [Saccharopolyspora pogona]|uniref:hypothetical protein n=1 Tax=Saccharopolyspora pogona TaxID=333966 RepID=UPI001688EC67|nr:hypothetical protein [Saccharopolyspora pogona]